MVTKYEFEQASKRGRRIATSTPKPLHVKYDRRNGKIVLELEHGVGFFFSPDSVEGLEGATASQLSAIEVTPSGLGLHFPKLDADIYLPSLFEGSLGSSRWMASHLGRLGGRTRSKAKTTAARANGKLGGRPKAAGKTIGTKKRAS